MSIKSTSISIRGDRLFVKACRAVAAKYGQETADFVREAIEALHGSEVSEAYRFLLAADGTEKVHANSLEDTVHESR